ncbi:MAG: hypothetical protein ACJ79R_23500 [Anaeromyxobacteraceae bacterium]
MTRAVVPWIVFCIFVAYLAAAALPLPVRSGTGFDLAAFGRLPVWANGRVQPFDSVARTGLLQIRGPVAPIDHVKAPQARPTTIDPAAWLLELLTNPDAADARRVFPISNRELLGRLQLHAASGGTSYYAFNDLGPRAPEIHEQLQPIENMKASDRTPWQVELIALRDRLMLYERLKNSLEPNTRLQQDAAGKPVTFDFAGELASYQADLADAVRVNAGRRHGSTERLDAAAEMRLRRFAALFQVVSRTGLLAVVPPSNATTGASNRWTNIGSVVVQSALGHQPSPAVAFLAGMSSAFAQGKADAFNSHVAGYRRWLAANGLAPNARRAAFEAFSNLLLPLVRAVVLYAIALVLSGVARRTSSATIHRSALMVVLLASALHATGLLFATILAGRPSWIALSGWAIGLAALAVKRVQHRGVGTLASAAIGLTALVAAYGVTPGGAASLLRNALETSLVVAIGATVFVLSVGRESNLAGPGASHCEPEDRGAVARARSASTPG